MSAPSATTQWLSGASCIYLDKPFRAGWPGRKPAAGRHHLEAAMVTGNIGQLGGNGFTRQFDPSTASGDNLASLAFCSGLPARQLGIQRGAELLCQSRSSDWASAGAAATSSRPAVRDAPAYSWSTLCLSRNKRSLLALSLFAAEAQGTVNPTFDDHLKPTGNFSLAAGSDVGHPIDHAATDQSLTHSHRCRPLRRLAKK